MQTISQTNCGLWRLVREIGHGAYGKVYLAERNDGESAAVKVCRRDDIGEERYARELRGAKLYSAIPPQEGLIRTRELVEEPWGFYTVMDLADDEFGGDLRTSAEYRPKTLVRVIEGEKALPLDVCVKLGITLAKGLATLQSHHLLHRDIKPGNVIYVGGRPVLSDPGLVVEESEAASLVGTPGYVPPENFTAAAGDVYSLGLTLKAASFGRRVEDLDKGPALEADTGASLFPTWWRILNKATDPTPSRRYQSAKALIKDLESLHRRMTVTSIAGSRVVKVALVLVLIGIVAIVASSMISVRRTKDNIALISTGSKTLKDRLDQRDERERALVEETVRSANWLAMTAGPSGLSMAEIFRSNLRWRIDRISATNTTQAAELKSLVDKMIKLGEKENALRAQIKELGKVAQQKRNNGHSDEKEFQRAKELDNEREKTFKTINSIYDELDARIK